MKRNDWLKLLLLQILTVPVVIALFRTFQDEKRIAAVIAGSIFVAIGVRVLVVLWKSGVKWRALSFWLALVHLFATSLPQVVMRLLYFDKDYTQILIFGIPGPVFHYYSEKVYVALVVATLLDWLLISRFFRK